MKAVVFDRPGPPEVLSWREVESPQPESGQVRIDVRAAGVNNADLLKRQGAYPASAQGQRILGLECAGTISAIGDEGEEWAVGDSVCALLDGGGYADQVVAPATQVLPVPRGVDFAQAAALPEAVCTVYANLAMKATVSAGQSVLVHGGGSGVGTIAIQWLKAVGATALTTAGSPGKVARSVELGADVAINYRTEDFVERTLQATGGRGVDAILDVVGAPYLEKNLKCLAEDGHLVIIGGSLGDSIPFDLSLLMAKRGSVSATMLNPRPPEQKAAIIAGVRENVWPLIEQGRIRPLIDTVVPMPEAAKAHELLHSGQTVGKVVLENPAAA